MPAITPDTKPEKGSSKANPKTATSKSAAGENEQPEGLHPAEAETLNTLTQTLLEYLPQEQVAEVRRAYRFGADAHSGQRRKSGEPYITHPLSVAILLGRMRLEPHTLIAGILHDTIEDTGITFEEIADEFGEDVAVLVDAVTKLDKVHFSSREELQAENFRKMLLAMSHDIRVILIKLADRLHNMRTLGAMVPEKRRRIGRETLDIYAPIAGRLGMNWVRKELEDTAFQAVYPWRHAALSRRMKKRWGNRRDMLSSVQETLERGMEDKKIPAEIFGREKHLYSLYKKMRAKKLDFTEVMDVFALRVIVDSIDDCYRMLGVAHNAYSPVPNRFKDYIAIPKANGYQSLHTVLNGPDGIPVELQIRTRMQDRVAENGIAAHWLYKSEPETKTAPEARSLEWLRSLLDIQQQAGDSSDFIESVKVDLFPDEVYVFTPKGDILRLPQDATVVDFAFAVHSDVGRATVAAKIDRRMTPLSSRLENGQTIEIITSNTARPNPAWLGFATTGKARAAIRHHLRSLKLDEAETMGRRLLDRALSGFDTHLRDLDESTIDRLLKTYNLESANTLYVEIGLGERSPMLVAHSLVHGVDADEVTGKPPVPLSITGGEGMTVTLGKCCHPLPGDPILGYLSSGRGLVVHRRGCSNLAEFRKQPDKWLEVDWAPEPDREYATEIRLDTVSRRGVLATVASLMAAEGCNIEHVEIIDRDSDASTMQFTFTVRDRVHLARVLRRLRNSDEILRATRV